MKTKFTSRLVSIAASTAVLLSATVLPIPSALTAQAITEGNMISNDFNTNNALPWHYVVTPPAKLERLESENGELDIKILNNGGLDVGGESRWDCLLRHRKLRFRSGEQYTVHAEVTSDTDGEIYTRISDLKRDVEIWHNGVGKGETEFDQNWVCMPLKANEKLTIDSTWTCAYDLPVAEWGWHFGGAGEYQDVDCFPEGTVLHFDNLILNSNTRDDYIWIDRFEPDIAIINEGYQVDAPKTATYKTAYPDNAPSAIYDIATSEDILYPRGEELGAFGANNTYALSALSLFLHPDILGDLSSAPYKNLVAAADEILKAQSNNSFGMPVESHKYSQTLHNGKVEADIIGFNYGSNADVVSNAMILAYAAAAEGEDTQKAKYMNGTYQAAEYLMGRNPLTNSYVTGTNGRHTCYPYHRYWAHGIDEEFPYPPKGVLVSGPNNMEYLDSEYMMMSGYTFDRDLTAPMQFYLDDNECYNVNEVSAPINASFAWLMNVLANNVDDNTAEVLDPEFSIDWTKRGDINGDSEINISDAIYLSRYSAEDANLESTGIKAVKEQMDVNDDGKINGEDVVLILRRISWGDQFETYANN